MCRCVVNGLFCVALSDTYRVHQTRCIWNIISWDSVIMTSNKVRLMKKAVERFISQAVATVKMSSIAFLELHVNPENEDEVINLVRCVRPECTKEDIVCTSITELGFVNCMRCFHLKQDPNKDDGLVVRIFGSALGRACSREREFLLLQVHGHLVRLQTMHYGDVIMGTIASRITSLTIVYSTVYSGADQRKHQSSASLAFVWGIHRDRWIPRTYGQ